MRVGKKKISSVLQFQSFFKREGLIPILCRIDGFVIVMVINNKKYIYFFKSHESHSLRRLRDNTPQEWERKSVCPVCANLPNPAMDHTLDWEHEQEDRGQRSFLYFRLAVRHHMQKYTDSTIFPPCYTSCGTCWERMSVFSSQWNQIWPNHREAAKRVYYQGLFSKIWFQLFMKLKQSPQNGVNRQRADCTSKCGACVLRSLDSVTMKKNVFFVFKRTKKKCFQFQLQFADLLL